jgi:class III poly(R)-hydroxyalkanoic acid synthase PhaE subunit
MMASDAGEGGIEALAHQYWSAWADALRQATGGANAVPAVELAATDWRQAMDWWSQLLPLSTTPQAWSAVEGLRTQSADWFGLMQQLASQFAGRPSSSEEVATAWRRSVQEQGDWLMQWALSLMRSGGQAGMDPCLQQLMHGLQKWRHDSAPWLEMPTFGLGRNQQSRWQALAKAQQDYQSRWQDYADQLKHALERAFTLFEDKLTEHEQVGNQLTSARALFDLWIEAAEEGYSIVALSEEFRQVYGAYANAHMRLRAALQKEVEQVCEHLGMPTRSEMDSAHRRITELERALRKLTAAGRADAELDMHVAKAAASAQNAANRSRRNRPTTPVKSKVGKVSP